MVERALPIAPTGRGLPEPACPAPRSARRRALLIATVLGTAAAALGLDALRRHAASAQAREHLAVAEQACAAAAAKRSRQFGDWIRGGKRGSRAFADEMLSLRGLWKSVWSRRSDEGGAEYRAWVREQFERHVFSDAALGGAMRVAVTGALQDFDAAENQLAIALQNTITGASALAGSPPFDERAFHTRVAELSRSAANADVGRMVGTEVAASIATEVFVQLGVRAGAIAGGAVTGWWTLGAGLVIGLIVDQLWRWLADPAAQIAEQVDARIDALAADAEAVLAREIGRAAEARVAVWQQVVEEVAG